MPGHLVSSSLRKFASNTSMHGAQKAVLSKSPLRRRLWLLLIVAACCMFVTNLTMVCHRYFSYPKRVDVDIVSDGVPFPSITLCNKRNLDIFTLKRIKENIKTIVVKNATHGIYDAVEEVIASLTNTSSDEFVKLKFQFYAVVDQFLFHVDRENDSLDFQQADIYQSFISPITLYANLPWEVIDKSANQLLKYVALCRHEKKECNILESFSVLPSSIYFKCFTYQSPPSNRTRLRFPPLREGYDYGWSTSVLSGSGILNEAKPQKFRIPGTFAAVSVNSESEGVHVILHPPGTTALPEMEGYDVPVGHSASFEIRPKLTERMDQPYGRCTMVNPYDSSRKESYYKKNECISMCVQKRIMQECGCVDVTLSQLKTHNMTSRFAENQTANWTEVNSGNGTEPIQFCTHIPFRTLWTTRDDEKIRSARRNFIERTQCVKRVSEEVYDSESLMEACQCFAPCLEYSYDVSYSLSNWPSSRIEGYSVMHNLMRDSSFSERFANYSREEDAEVYWNYTDENLPTALKDFVRVNVYAGDSSIIKNVEKPDYLLFQLISDVGGQLGMWIGVSVITLSEAFEMLIFIIRNFSNVERSNLPNQQLL